MKIHFDNVSFSSTSGPNSFATRLAQQLFKNGIEVTLQADDADASLVFIERSGQKLAKKVVQRLDGIWFKPGEDIKNLPIKMLYNVADHVIWQSEFDKSMTTSWFGNRSGTIIHNGIDLNIDVSNIKLFYTTTLRQTYEKIFVCSANWHGQKRLKSNVALFRHLQKTYKNSCLIILGSNPDVRVAAPNVYYAGNLPHDYCLALYESADWMIHLAWLDHCPNVVVEALSRKLPVICSEQGGTKELVRNYGIILKEEEYNFKAADYDNPPDIDVTQLDELPDRSSLGEHENIDINYISKKYIELFESVVKI